MAAATVGWAAGRQQRRRERAGGGRRTRARVRCARRTPRGARAARGVRLRVMHRHGGAILDIGWRGGGLAPGRGGDRTTARIAARSAQNQLARQAGTAARPRTGSGGGGIRRRFSASSSQSVPLAPPRPALFGRLDCVAVRLSMLGGRAWSSVPPPPPPPASVSAEAWPTTDGGPRRRQWPAAHHPRTSPTAPQTAGSRLSAPALDLGPRSRHSISASDPGHRSRLSIPALDLGPRSRISISALDPGPRSRPPTPAPGAGPGPGPAPAPGLYRGPRSRISISAPRSPGHVAIRRGRGCPR